MTHDLAAVAKPQLSQPASAARLTPCVLRLAMCGLVVALVAGPRPHRSVAEEPADTAAAAESTGTAALPARPAITRADLAAAYLRLEQAFFARPLPPDQVARINRSFDQATQAFFLGNNSEAIRTIDLLTQSLRPAADSSPEDLLVSLKVTVDPPVVPADSPRPIVCRVTSIYAKPSDGATATDLRLRLLDPAGDVVAERTCTVTGGNGRTDETSVTWEFSGGRLAPGLYHIEIASAEGRGLIVGRVHVIEGAGLDEQRLANEKRLSQIEAGSTPMSQALATCRARNHLLNDRPSEENSAQFLADLNALAADVAAEIRALESGVNPYANRQGDYWRVLAVGKREISLRLYVPKLAVPATPAPLLVVLHGMGGDENMFFEAYGAGVVKRIADEKGLIVAAPLTYSFGGDIKNLQTLIDVLDTEYAIDRERVYVLGHSMGAGGTAGLARSHADTVAAACCIAGGRFQSAPNSAPLLVVSPELDGVVPANRLQHSARQAIAGGLPGELKVMLDYGHTLAVGAILPEAIDWLLQHQRPPAQ